MPSLRILLADDNDEILATIRQELAGEFEIIGTVSNGQDAVDAVLRFDPDGPDLLTDPSTSELSDGNRV